MLRLSIAPVGKSEYISASEARDEYEANVKKWYEKEKSYRTQANLEFAKFHHADNLRDMSPLFDLKIRKGSYHTFRMKASERLYLSVRTDDEPIV